MTSKTTRALVAVAAAGSLFAAPAVTLDAHAAPMPAVTVVARPGTTGATVTNIQRRLNTLGYLSSSSITGFYGNLTTAAVKKFQAANHLAATGVTDRTTYNLISTKAGAVTRARAAQQSAHNNAVVARPGQTSTTVKQIQGRLAGLGYLSNSSITGFYGNLTTAAVKSFQRANGLSVTGVVNGRTNDLIIARYRSHSTHTTPAVRLDPRCYVGRTICVNKSTLKMYWVINGKIQDSYTVRVGRPSLPTREGLHHIYLKSTDWYSTLYHVHMPYTQFFDGGEAVHYSRDFALNGYAGGGSHGCVNMRSLTDAKWLYNQTRVGDRVVVYR